MNEVIRAEQPENDLLGGDGGQLPPSSPVLRNVLAALLALAAIVAVGAALFVVPNAGLALVAIVGIGIPAIVLLWKWPVAGVLALLFLNASFVRMPWLQDLGVGGLDIPDVVLIGLLGLMVLRGLYRGRLVIPWWPVSAPLLVLVMAGVFSTLYAILYMHVALNLTLNELRPIIFFLGFLAVAWSIETRRDLIVVLAGLFVISDVIVAIIVAQQFMGFNNPILGDVMVGSGRTWLLWMQEGAPGGFGSIRVVPNGHIITYAASIIAFCWMLYPGQPRRLRNFAIVQFLYLNVGLLLTFTRAQWIASTLSLVLASLVMAYIYRSRIKPYVVPAMLTVLVLGFALFVLIKEGTAASTRQPDNPLMARLMSIFTPDETLESGSLQWRVFETDEAVRSLEEHPYIGVGLGNTYRTATTMLRRETVGDLRFARFMHNAYLYYAVKMGVLGLIALLWFCLAYLTSGMRAYFRMPIGPWRPAMLGITACFIGIMTWSITQPHFMLPEGGQAIGLVVGIAAGIAYIGDQLVTHPTLATVTDDEGRTTEDGS